MRKYLISLLIIIVASFPFLSSCTDSYGGISPALSPGTGLPFLNWQTAEHRSSAFTGGSDSTHGDVDNTPTYTIFTVTGVVAIKAFVGIVNTTITDAADNATIDLGLGIDINYFLAVDPVGAAGEWTAGDIIGDFNAGAGAAGGDNIEGNVAFSNGEFLITDGNNITETVATEDITGGQIDYFVIWAPCEAGASILEAGTLSQV